MTLAVDQWQWWQWWQQCNDDDNNINHDDHDHDHDHDHEYHDDHDHDHDDHDHDHDEDDDHDDLKQCKNPINFSYSIISIFNMLTLVSSLAISTDCYFR